MKYITEAYKDKLTFTINEGQFKGVKYTYNKLSSNGEITYTILEGKKLVNENNKLLFVSEINEILNKKLAKIKK